MTDTTAGAALADKAREVEILVNKRPVRVPSPTTGKAIKAEARVPDDDQLFRVEGDREIPVADDQVVEVHDGARFVATPPIEPA
jgi:hypothetical protein